jgi:hypothetical protein
MIKYLLQDLLKQELKDLITTKEFVVTVRKFLMKDKQNEICRLAKLYDLSKIDESVQLMWVQWIAMKKGLPFEALIEILETFPTSLKDRIWDILFPILQKNDLQKLLEIKNNPMILTPQEAFMKFCTQLLKHPSDFNFFGSILLSHPNVDWYEIHPLTEEPSVFICLNSSAYIEFKAIKAYPKRSQLLDVKNKEKLTPLLFLQKSYLETNDYRDDYSSTNWMVGIFALCQELNRDYEKESYPAFIEVYGPLTSFPKRSLNKFPQNKKWIDRVLKGQEDPETLIHDCPSSRLLPPFQMKKLKVSYWWEQEQALLKQEELWVQEGSNLLSAPVLNEPEILAYLAKVDDFTAVKVLGEMLSEERFSEFLPSLLERLYPLKEDFVKEDHVYAMSECHTLTHPIFYHDLSDCNFRKLIDFLGLDNIPNLTFSEKMEGSWLDLLDRLSEEEVIHLYKANPDFFSRCVKKYKFFETIFFLPVAVRTTYIQGNRDILKDSGEYGTPNWWFVVLSLDHLSLDLEVAKQLCQELDHLDLKTTDGLTFEECLDIAPKHIQKRAKENLKWLREV